MGEALAVREFDLIDGLPSKSYLKPITGVAAAWFFNGEIHREDGPAISYPGRNHWALNGVGMTEEELKIKVAEAKARARERREMEKYLEEQNRREAEFKKYQERFRDSA